MRKIYEMLNGWLDESRGLFIEIGGTQPFSFARSSPVSMSELLAFEAEKKQSLPRDYKTFLLEVGAVNLFSTQCGSGIDILAPWDIESFSKQVFRNYGEDPYPTLLLTTSIPQFGYFGGFWTERDESENYAIFYPEIPPELWVEEAEFKGFDEWIARLAELKCKYI